MVFDLIIRCVSVSALLTMIPGPNTLVVLRNAVRNRFLAVLAALGTSAGALTWGVVAAIGLAVFLRRFADLYQAVKLAGACYLIVLGAMTIWSTVRHRKGRSGGEDQGNDAEGQVAATPPGRLRAFQAGYASDVLNPKTGIFYIAIVPQIIPAQMPVSAGILLFSSLDAVITGAWFTFIAVCIAQLSLRLFRPRVIRMAERITGVVLIGFGLRTMLESS